jgi:hypothetical protein
MSEIQVNKDDILNKDTILNQDQINIFEKFNFKDVDLNIYTLKINSRSRNTIKEPSPFSFDIAFNREQETIETTETIVNGKTIITKKKVPISGIVIPSKFENIKKIQITQILIPRYIPRDYIGEPINGVTPIRDSSNSLVLSYYPGINLNNTVITITDISSIQTPIEVIELVDLNNKKHYLIALEYNNPYYLSKCINIKAELYSYININNTIYPITNIFGSRLILDNTDEDNSGNPIVLTYTNRLIIADFYKNNIFVQLYNNNNERLYIGTNFIIIRKTSLKNYQYILPNQYLEYQTLNDDDIRFINKNNLFKISQIYDNSNNKIYNILKDIDQQVADDEVRNNNEDSGIIIMGEWVANNKPSQLQNLTHGNIDINSVKINHFNFGIRDLLDEKIFYANLLPFIPNKSVSCDPEINNSFGVFFPATQSKDYLFLRGDSFEVYNNNNLKNTNSKLNFTLLDSNYEEVGLIFHKYPQYYNPSLFQTSVKAFLPNIPDITVIIKIEEIDRKNLVNPLDVN